MKPETENRHSSRGPQSEGKPITIDLFGVPISVTPLREALATITHWVTESQGPRAKGLAFSPKIVVTPNPEMIVAAQKDPGLLSALQEADLAIPDGIGVIWALRLLRICDPNDPNKIHSEHSDELGYSDRLQRISGLSLMLDLIALAAQNRWRVMLLGGKPGVAHRAAEILIRKTQKTQSVRTSEGSEIRRIRGDTSGDPKLRQSDVSGSPSFPSVLNVVGLTGSTDITRASRRDLDRLITVINKVKPDLLFVGFGHGKQETWMAQQRDRLDVGVMMGVGGALDQIVDPTLRPPAYIYSIGLGWLYRLVREPWRWKRQLALLTFARMVSAVMVKRARTRS